MAAFTTRKWLSPADPGLYDPTPAQPGLQTLAALRPVVPPGSPPHYGWQQDGADGAQPRSLADYAGHGVVLNIWATWCEPCTREMPSLARLAIALQPVGITVLPVSIDRSGAPSIRAFYTRHAIADLPVLTDMDADAMMSLGIGAIPVTLLIGPNGTVRGRLDGGADWSAPDAVQTIRRLIGS